MKKDPLKTSLYNGFTSKTDFRICFFGEVDLLSSYIMELTHYVNSDELKETLKEIVQKLSSIMGIVAGYTDEFSKETLDCLLKQISKYKTTEEGIIKFVLPGGTLISAKIHIVRTLSRKAELAYAKVYENYGGDNLIFEYLNKLSTFFYELALYFESKENE